MDSFIITCYSDLLGFLDLQNYYNHFNICKYLRQGIGFLDGQIASIKSSNK